MNSSTMAAVFSRSWTKDTRSDRAWSSRTTEARAMPTEASSSTGFTISGKRRSLGRRQGAPSSISMKRGVRDVVVGEHHLGQRLVAGQDQAGRVRRRCRARPASPAAGHAVVQRRQVAEALGQVEHHVEGLGPQPGQQLGDVAAEAEQPHLVAARPQHAGHLELHLVDCSPARWRA